MKVPERGRMIHIEQYLVLCSECLVSEIEETIYSSKAAEAFQKKGWIRKPTVGWMCPACRIREAKP